MRLVHRRGPPDDHSPSVEVLATDIEIAETFVSQARGLMFRRSIPDEYALVFQFDEPASRDLHMVFVPFAIDAVWLVETEVVAVKRLRPWIGLVVGLLRRLSNFRQGPPRMSSRAIRSSWSTSSCGRRPRAGDGSFISLYV